ncbi:MAG: PAS domain S-box protein [Chloroflexi bacterium]|nr:PAS domain S-box protein [Chloroflexota bacterium]
MRTEEQLGESNIVAADVAKPRRGMPAPRNEARELAIHELFFSTTDRKGIIRSGNRVFVRVSAYSRAELVGSPHNVIRHPDMPRAVFQLLWDEIEAGRPIAAYVKNLAKDGRYYWVMATVVPIEDGYLSVRLKPSTPFFDAAQAIYPQLLALEKEVEGGEPRRRKEAIAASTARLLDLLRDAGFPSYEAFMHAALAAEVKSRDALIGSSVHRRLATAPVGADPALVEILAACVAISDYFDGLVTKLDDYVALNQKLEKKASYVLDLADDVRLFSLNALLASTRVGGAGAPLGAIAGIMGARCDASDPVFQELTSEITAARELLGDMLFRVAATKIQAEIATVFVNDLLQLGDDARTAATDVSALARCLADGIDGLVASLTGFESRTEALGRHVVDLKADLGVLRALEVNGRIEAARASLAEAVVALFTSIGEQIAAARRELDDLSHVGLLSLGEDATEAKRIRNHVEEILDHVAPLRAA